MSVSKDDNQNSTLWSNQAFTVSHADGTGVAHDNMGVTPGFHDGLRAFFEYRDLGVKAATKGSYAAHVIRAIPGRHAEPQWHIHDLDFQMIYIIKGWVVFEYETVGEVVFHAGSSAVQPPGIKHREIKHSDDLELIEITSPADFKTHLTDAP